MENYGLFVYILINIHRWPQFPWASNTCSLGPMGPLHKCTSRPTKPGDRNGPPLALTDTLAIIGSHCDHGIPINIC